MVTSVSLGRRPGWIWLTAGVVAIIGGLLALFDPVAATFTAEQIAGWA